jgi:hypothetical protein
VIEPHADDAWLSIGEHIEAWVGLGCAVEIITVYGDSTRCREAARYAEAVGATWRGMRLPERGHGGAVGWIAEPVDPGKLADWIGDRPAVFPLGIHHPEHLAVAAAAPAGAWRYVDLPYALESDHATETSRKIAGRTIASWSPATDRYRHARVFRSQAPFLFDQRRQMRHAPELILA